jgi:hypothetical protein
MMQQDRKSLPCHQPNILAAKNIPSSADEILPQDGIFANSFLSGDDAVLCALHLLARFVHSPYTVEPVWAL